MTVELKKLIKAKRSMIPVGEGKQALVDWPEYGRRFPRTEELLGWALAKPPKWAMVTGALSRVITLDFDGERGAERMRKLRLTPNRKTPNGFHVDIDWDGNALRSGAVEEGVDLRGEAGYVIVLGPGYEWLSDSVPRRDIPKELYVRRLELPF